MGDYFKPWRRKFGVVTLVMALGLMGAWTRSQRAYDSMLFANGDRAIEAVVSAEESLAWIIYYESPSSLKPLPMFDSFPLAEYQGFFSEDSVDWNWKWCGFRIGDLPVANARVTFRVMPYWAIIFPFALLSARLLFSKSRKPKQPSRPSNETQER